jgi:hypothetical protein
MRKGAPWLKTTLAQCAWAAARKKGSYLQAQFHRLRSRRGAKKAIGALAASILTAAYHMLIDGILISRSRPRPLRPQGQNRTDQAPPHPLAKSRLRRPDHPRAGMTGDLFLSRPCGRI